jgi:DHA1 family bicyclomycin/chloramphenicol resistance-like MFS transporter
MGGSFINSRVVMRAGMRSVLVWTYAGQVTLTVVVLGLILTGLMPEALAFPAHILWSIGIFGMMGLTMGNLNALAMEELGHIAGFAASVITAISTVVSVLLAVPVGLAFDGTPVPLLAGATVFSVLALGLIQFARRPVRV